MSPDATVRANPEPNWRRRPVVVGEQSINQSKSSKSHTSTRDAHIPARPHGQQTPSREASDKHELKQGRQIPEGRTPQRIPNRRGRDPAGDPHRGEGPAGDPPPEGRANRGPTQNTL